MRYFVPELALGVLLLEETELVEKFGGKPWGLPPEKWPLCKTCGEPLSHMFTLKHDADRLDLGKAGRVLMAFMCNHEPGCDTWDMDSGANAVLVLDSDELRTGLTDAPDDGARVEVEAFIVSWQQSEDVVPEADEAVLFDAQAYCNLSAPAWQDIYQSTKLAGLPYWLQFPEGPTVPPFRFVGQFDDSFVFHGQLPSAARAFCPIYRWDNNKTERQAELPPEGWVPPSGGPSALYVSGEGSYRCDGPNFGDVGMAYLFLTALPQPHLFDLNPPMDTMLQGKFLWQCT